jgi:hypothetical protein
MTEEKLILQRFSKVVVVGMDGKDKYGAVLCKCICDCGRMTTVRRYHLTSGHTKSCGKCNKDLAGKRFGRLLVICEVERISSRKESCWECLCDCGNTSIVPGSRLRLKRKGTRSCGCLQLEELKKANSLPKGQSATNRVKRVYEREAKSRGLEWSLSNEQFLILTSGDCYYCGKIPGQVCIERNGNFVYNGIDRIDNDVGYETANCVSCCKDCNFAKRDMSYDKFINMCLMVAEKHNERVNSNKVLYHETNKYHAKQEH